MLISELMNVKTTNIFAKNLINKYNNSIYENYEEDEVVIVLDVYSAS